MKHFQADTWTRSRSNQSQEKRQKPPLRLLDHGGVFADHKARSYLGATMAIQSGDPIPNATVTVMAPDGPQLRTTDQIFKGRKVVLFGVAGAFTPVCDKDHLPGFLDNLDQFKAQGVDEIAVTGVNDVFVMEAWAKSAGADGKISFLADGNGDFARALGLSLDLTARGLGIRSQRYAMIVDNGVVRKLNLEAAPGKVETSSAETLLKQL
jgi:glutaredoxin/glutathione-dependent peroxiredoxin